MWFSLYVFINVRAFNQCDIYICLSCGFHPVFINVRTFNQCDIYLFVMWFSSYVFTNVRTFNQCDIYLCLSCLSTSCLCFVCLSLHHKGLYEQLPLHHQRELFNLLHLCILPNGETNGDSILLPGDSLIIRVITKLPNSEQSYKGKVKTHNYINRQNQSTTGKL